jgi:predicted nuclease with RNAse H fold
VTDPVYLGVDVAGAKNTWACALSGSGSDSLKVVHGPRLATLEEVVSYCEQENVVAAAVDAQLTVALSEENGFRTSDLELRELLPKDCRGWVASFNSLMAVPLRGRMLADHLSPTVGTLVETHPRASLLFALGEEAAEPVRRYKGSTDRAVREAHARELWRLWSERFDLAHEPPVQNDGELDALVCATVAYLYHHAPGKLHRLRHNVAGKTGRGPFYVVAPTNSVGVEALAGKIHGPCG